MIKALLKKQLLEVFSFLFIDNKRTRRTGKRFVGFLLLYALLFAYVGGAVFMMAKTLCEALVPMGLTWFYFALMALILARSVNESGAWTMPELIERWLGRPARSLVACLIVPGWVLILAAQFLAVGKLTAVLTGLSPEMALAVGAGLLILYPVLGGQASVMRCDLPHGLILLCGLLAGVFCLSSGDAGPLQGLDISLLNEDFGPERAATFLLVMGGSCLAGPTMFGVLMSAKDAPSARRGAWQYTDNYGNLHRHRDAEVIINTTPDGM